LIVEDDTSVRESTALLLESSGLEAEGASTGEEALDVLARDQAFDLLILDLMLPGIDGLEVCRRVRRQSNLPVLMLTAKSEVDDIVTGLELGADDYVVKPFEGAELLARVRAAVRRQHMDPPAPRMTIGPLTVDPAAFRAELHGQRLDLTAMEFRLLLELVRHAGQVMTREMLLDLVWGYDFLGDSRLVDMAVKRLRDKLGEDGRAPRFLSTVRGVGYRFERDEP
jgi:two-component system response regulator MtrA